MVKLLAILMALVVVMALVLGSQMTPTRGGGMTAGPVVVGPSQEARDTVAQERTRAEIADQRAKTQTDIAIRQAQTQADLAQARLNGERLRQLALIITVALFIGGLLLASGLTARAATPALGEAVEGLRLVAEVQRGRRVEISLEVGPDSYVARLLAEGMTPEDIAALVQQAPALDAPRVLALQRRVGARGMAILARREELSATIESIAEDREDII